MPLCRFLLWLIMGVVSYSNIFAQERYEYQNRGNRFEGIHEIKVGAYDLELLSFTGFREPTPIESDVALKLKFYVNMNDSLFITAKELYPPLKLVVAPIFSQKTSRKTKLSAMSA